MCVCVCVFFSGLGSKLLERGYIGEHHRGHLGESKSREFRSKLKPQVRHGRVMCRLPMRKGAFWGLAAHNRAKFGVVSGGPCDHVQMVRVWGLGTPEDSMRPWRCRSRRFANRCLSHVVNFIIYVDA